MKILAQASRENYIVEMSVDEIARAAGFSSSHDHDWKKLNNFDSKPAVGCVIKVDTAYSFHHRVLSHQKEAGSAANTLRALADLIGGALPDVVIPPVDPDFDEVK